MPTKSEVGILFDTLPDFEVHNHADTRIVRCYFRFYHESRFYAERKPFQSPVFTRKRKMPFHDLLKFLLSMHKTSTQCALNSFLERKGITMSQQALSKARSKFDHTPFLKLFTGIRDAFYGKAYLETLRKYHGKFLVAIDGSETPLPNLPELLEK